MEQEFSILDKTASLFGNAKSVQQLAQRAVDLVVGEMSGSGLVASSIYKINDATQMMEAFAYAVHGGKGIDRLLPKQFDQLALPMKAKDNLTIKIAKTEQVRESKEFADFSRGAVPDVVANSVQKLLGGQLTIGFPLRVASRKTVGVALFMFSSLTITPQQREMLDAFVKQITTALAQVTSMLHITSSHKKDLRRLDAQKPPKDMATVRFTLRISPNQDTKLRHLARQKNIPKADVIRDLLEKAS